MNNMKSNTVSEVIAGARKAQKDWAALPYKARAACLKKAGAYLARNIDEICGAISEDTGKLPLDALAAELLPAVMALRYYIRRGKKFLRSEKTGSGSLLMVNKKSRLYTKPYGVIGIISPWNYPFAIPFSEVVMALLAGNAVLLKTAALTAHVGKALEKIFSAADLPDGVFNYVEIPGREAGPAFIDGVDKLFFTGSSATGRELMALASKRLLPLVLELGGADAAIIRSDADLDRAVWGIVWAGFSNAGQSCGGAQRIIVDAGVYNAFREKLGAVVKTLRPGTDLGRMASLKQKQAVRAQVERCLAMGAQIAVKSEGAFLQDDSNLMVPAIVLENVRPDMPVMNEEIFGPVIALIPSKNDEDALRIANASPYGLTSSVWTRSRRAGKSLALRINAGAVMINDHLMSHGLAETPWGGFGDSGLGRTHGEAGFKEMVKLQVIVDETMPGAKKNIFWHPYSEKVYSGLRAALSMLCGTLAEKAAGIPALLGVFLRYWEK